MTDLLPEVNCTLCPRLADFREKNKQQYPTFHNAPVHSFGPANAQLLILGLAPGLKGANCTGRPFTGDFAGDLLYATLKEFDFAAGAYGKHANDGLQLKDCRVVNAVRCVPPENKPTPGEIRTCNSFLKAELASLNALRVVIALGRVAHDALLMACNLKKSHYRFSHAGHHELPEGLHLLDSYHCSRYNTNTGRLTEAMFHEVFVKARALLRDQSN